MSQATLDSSTLDENNENIVQLWLHTDGTNHLLCNLNKQTSQVPLDLAFTEGESVAFFSKGAGTVHLSGYLLPDGYGFPGEEDDDERFVNLLLLPLIWVIFMCGTNF